MTGAVTRRHVLAAMGLGAVGIVAGGLAGRHLLAGGDGVPPGSGPDLWQPQVFSSANGSLHVELRAAPGVDLAGRATRALGYSGTSPGPTLRVRPGDDLRITLVNDLAASTNLHTHGLRVSPSGLADNVFREVTAGSSAEYEYHVFEDQPAGTFWYHPHHHGTVAGQVFAGLLGAVVVTADDEPQADAERLLVVSDTTIDAGGAVAPVSGRDVMVGREGELVLVNGQLRPRFTAATGTLERWRIVNACTSRFLRLALDGHRFEVIGIDGHAYLEPAAAETISLAPGNRADALVRFEVPGAVTLRTLDVDRLGAGMMPGMSQPSRAVDLAAVSVDGREAGVARRPWRRASAPVDLRAAAVDARRELSLTMGMGMGMGGGGMTFGFDGRSFDPDRVDQAIRLGTVEEWTIRNDTPMDHPFHLHVWPMQVVSGPDSDPAGPPQWRNVVVVPASASVTVRIPVTRIGGRTVYHCHILDHEDNGMMGVVEAS